MYVGRRELGTQQMVQSKNGSTQQGTGNPAERSDMVPLSRLLESGHFNPGLLRPPERSGLEGVSEPWAKREFLLHTHGQVGGYAAGTTGKRRGFGSKLARVNLFSAARASPRVSAVAIIPLCVFYISPFHLKFSSILVTKSALDLMWTQK